jgi:O-antigen ligase
VIGNVQVGAQRLRGRSASNVRLGVIALGALAVNVVIGVGLASGHSSLIVAVAVGVPAFVVLSNLLVARRDWIVFAAVLLTMIGGPLLGRLPGTGGTAVFPSDLFLALAIAGYIIHRLSGQRDTARSAYRFPFILTWPLALFTFTLLLGVFRGHQRYGTSLLSQPTRMFLYAGIAFAVSAMRMPIAYRQLVRLVYAVTIAQALVGAYHLATGTSQTSVGSSELSTGGTRALALTTAMFLASSLVLALLNLEFGGKERRWLHGTVAGLAMFGVVIALGRTTFAAVAVVVPLLIVGLRHLRRTMLAYAPLLAALLAAFVAVLLQVDPSLGSTFSKRLNSHVGTDTSLIQRQRKFHATLQGFGNEPLLGLGFGRPVTFTAIDGTETTFSGDPEDSYIYILAGSGVFGLGALIVLILSFFADSLLRLRRAVGEDRSLIIFAMALVFILLVNALSYPLLSDPNLMLMFWIAMLLPTIARTGAPVSQPETETAL